MSRLVNTELKSESEPESESDTELMAKRGSTSDSEQLYSQQCFNNTF